MVIFCINKMNIVYLLLCVIPALPCVNSQITVSISGPTLVRPSENIRMACKVTGAPITDGSKIHAVDWVRQLKGDNLEFLAHLNYAQGSAFNPSLKSRLTLSRDTAKNEVYLDVRTMQAEDSGIYYCAKDNGSGRSMDYWGQGTNVFVTSEPITAPSVFPLLPCCNNVDFNKEVTMGCLVSGFIPEPVEIQWNGGSIKSGIMTSNSVLSTSGFYMQSSQLSIPALEWKNSTYQCNVKHASTGTNQEKTVRVLPCIQPTVQILLQSPCGSSSIYRKTADMKNVNATLDLVCMISDFYPRDIQVKWFVNEKDDVSDEASPPSPLETKDGTFSASSRLTILKGQWNRETKYTCAVTHLSSNNTIIDNISKCAESCLDSLQVYLIPPSFEDLYISRIAKIYCLVSGMRTIDNFEVSWTREQEGKLDVVNENPVLQDNGTFSALSILTVCAEEWESREKFICTVRNQELPSPIKKTIFKPNEGTPKAPAVYLHPPSQEELSLQEMISVTALVMGFKPSNIFIKWQQAGIEIDNEKYVNISPMKKEGEDTYFTISVLSVSAADWNKGYVYTCIVGHEALPYYLKQQSIDKSSGKPTNVNVSLVLSDTGSTCN